MSEDLPKNIPDVVEDHDLLEITVNELVHDEEDRRLRIEAQEAWLERRDIDPASTPHITMGRQEYDMFKNAPNSYLGYVRRVYGIPQSDQVNCEYVLIDIKNDDPSLPNQPELVIVDDNDFGTTIPLFAIAEDFQESPTSPDVPSVSPESGNMYMSVDIGQELDSSKIELEEFISKLMQGITVDPFHDLDGDIGVRAGALHEGQTDAYVWTSARFSHSIGLTVSHSHSYDSVCIVRGQQREAGNGKAGMAQIIDPEIALEIKGEFLTELQSIYKTLYRVPDFALTEGQRSSRDYIINSYLEQLITREATRNRDAEQRQRSSRNTLKLETELL